MPNTALPQTLCACGFDKNHPEIEAEPHYTLWNWFLLSIGITAKPHKTTYRCRRCKRTTQKEWHDPVS